MSRPPRVAACSLLVACTIVGLASCTRGADSPGEEVTATGTPATGGTTAAPSWPGLDDTGATGPLRPVGGRVVSRRGAVVEDLEVRGTLTVRADDVTIRNVLVRPSSYYGILVYGRNTRIEDSTVAGSNLRTMAGIAAVEHGSFVAQRVEVTGVEDGIRLAHDSVVADSYVHGLQGDEGSHFDGVTADGFTGWRIVHNTILNPHSQTGAVWVGDARSGPSEGELRDNYLAGGGYTIYAGPGTARGIRVVGNAFSTRYHERAGRWGVSTGWDPRRNQWRDNTWADGPLAGQTVSP